MRQPGLSLAPKPRHRRQRSTQGRSRTEPETYVSRADAARDGGGDRPGNSCQRLPTSVYPGRGSTRRAPRRQRTRAAQSRRDKQGRRSSAPYASRKVAELEFPHEPLAVPHERRVASSRTKTVSILGYSITSAPCTALSPVAIPSPRLTPRADTDVPPARRTPETRLGVQTACPLDA